jgi:2-succinyl-6-hydroxy-2,4-cyclohexadiene-1-carboxylate synthase
MLANRTVRYDRAATVSVSGIQRIEVRDGLVLRAEVLGEGAPVLLLHGFSGSVEAWGDRILRGLAQTHRVIAVDLPGHGGSDAPLAPARYALPSVVEDLSLLLSALGVQRAHWIGYSMGGRVALGAALLAPERVHRLVLESASPGLASDEERGARRAQDEELARRIERDGIEAFVDGWAALPLFRSQQRLPRLVLDAERRRRLKNAPRALATCLRGLGTGVQPSFWGRLGEVRAPVLLLTGEEDAKFGGIARAMSASIPECQALVIPSAGHAVHLEAPEPWLEAVKAWLG